MSCTDGSCDGKNSIDCCGCSSPTVCKSDCLGRNYSTPAGCNDESTNHGSLWVWNATGGRNGKAPAWAGAGCSECAFCNGNMNDGDCKKWARDNGKSGVWTGTCNGGSSDDSLVCVKTSWDNSNKLQCCLGHTNNVEDCDPTWGKGNMLAGVCNDVMNTYCTNSENVSSTECQEWCGANQGVCDSAMKGYCDTDAGKKDDLCSCINSTIPRPSCFDTICTTKGYQTSTTPDMISDAKNCGQFCGEIISCINQGINGGCSQNVDQGNVSINCGTNPNPSTNPILDWIYNNKFMIIVIIFLIILIIFYIKVKLNK